MKRLWIFLLLFSLALTTTACLLPTMTKAAIPQSEHRCGDGVCDGPENARSCPQDCAGEQQASVPSGQPEHPTEEFLSSQGSGSYSILYQLNENTASVTTIQGTTCYVFNFLRYLDGGYIRPDGSGNKVLRLKDHPTSQVAAATTEQYYYISTPNDPLVSNEVSSYLNYDVAGQTLWAASFAGGEPEAVAESHGDRFPGGVAVSPGNRYLLYPLTSNKGKSGANSGVRNKVDPTRTDSALVIRDLSTGQTKTVLNHHYNRQLFASFHDFSPDGQAFYTLAREGKGFQFVKISLATGDVEDFETLFPKVNWDSLDWSALFTDDFVNPFFSISPDETRLLGFKAVFSFNMETPCISDVVYHRWLFNLDSGGNVQIERNRLGMATDISWKGDSTAFALAVVDHGTCYPGYLSAAIETFDRDANAIETLVVQKQSKIDAIGWSPDGTVIAYSSYGVDFVGRLSLVNVETKAVTEVLNTQMLGYTVNQTNPVTLNFIAWIEGR